MILFSAAATAVTGVETFDGGLLHGTWVVSDIFGGQADSVLLISGACTFHKAGTAAASTQSLALANAQADHRAALPWSVEYVVPHLSELAPNGAGILNRFWKSGAAVYDWINVRNVDGTIIVGTADGSPPLFTFPSNATSLLKVRFDATFAGLVVYATTDLGSYGQGKTVKWQQEVGSDTALGMLVMATDLYGASVAGPFDIAIDNISLTTGVLPSGVEAAQTPRFNPRYECNGAKNLIRNSSFECGGDLWSSLGKATGWGGELSGLYGTIETGEAWDGRHSLRIDLGPGVTPVTFFDGWPAAHDRQHAPLAANIGWTRVDRGEPVTLSACLKSNVAGTKARFLFRFAKGALDPIQEASHEFTLTREWARYTVTQSALDEDVCVAIGPDMTGMPDTAASFWMDAVQLERGSTATEFKTHEPVELRISTGRHGNVYAAFEPVTLDVRGDNRSTEDFSTSLRLELEDYFGTALPPALFSAMIPAGNQSVQPWTVPVPGKGWYRAMITWTANGRVHKRAVVFSVIESYTHQDSPFGLNHPATTETQLRLLSKAGIRWVRDWAVNWDWVEPVRGQESWAEADAQIGYLSSAGMNTLVVFPNPSTNWASSAPESVEKSLWYRLAYAPSEPELLNAFIGKAVDRYRKSCSHWEFLNEPLWVPNFCLPQNGGYKVADYIGLLAGAYGAIKAVNPEAKVIGGLAIEPQFPLGDEFIAGGGLKYCDIYNLHPYGGLTVPEEFIKDMERIHHAMDATGQRKPIWATETAYYGVDDKPWTPWVAPPGHFSAGLLLSSERTAADYIVRHAIIMLAYGTAKIFYHEPLDGAVNNGTLDIENTFLSPDAVPKKCYAAVSALANLLGPSPSYAGRFPADDEDGGMYGYAFACDGHAVLAAWAPPQEGVQKVLAMAVPKECTAYDIMGNQTPSGNVTLSASPVYIVSSALPAEALIAGCKVHSLAEPAQQ
jgi:hypothetical protein